ncbi:MAG: glycosyltransferase [Patescibacteria group bacterium]|nr:glycosyltransferase [Patescibacteria group bacterium]
MNKNLKFKIENCPQRVSIIIPLLAVNDYLRESIPQILKLKNCDLEIIVLPNERTNEKWPKTKIIPTGFSNASKKRNLGVKNATGKIVAFLDDDAFPKADWLKYALAHFKDKKVVAVGGPAITPKNNSVLQKASAAAYESFIGGGQTRNRYLPIGQAHEIDDWPSVNLLVCRDIFQKTSGFDSRYWPGEDTKLCLELLKYGQIIYEPKAQVYHHRRGSLIKHLRQIGNYGLHRGHFARKYPQTSMRLFYLMPTFFSIYLIVGFILLFISSQLSIINYPFNLFYYFIPLFIYFLLMLIDIIIISFRYKNPLVGIATIPYIFFTHFYYGLRFIKGYCSRDIAKSTHSKKSQ